MRVKICGMASAEDVDACVAAGADALGFIFADSPRRLAPDDGVARTLTAAVPPFVTCVGVFANDGADVVRAALASCRLDLLQFCGDETPEFCGSFGKPTILSVRDRSFDRRDLAVARAVALVIDAFAPGIYGGTGALAHATAVERAREHHPGVPLILAGGLTPANVRWVAGRSRPYAVDVRSGVERDGRKDAQLVRAFVEHARESAA